MEKSISYSSIWKLTLPIIISGVTQNIVTVIDTLFLSQLGKVAIGAAGNGVLFYFLVITVGMGISTGGQLLIGNANGAKEHKSIGKIVEQCFYIFLPLSFILFLGFQFCYPIIANTISQSEKVAEAAISFVTYRSYGVLFAFINFLFIAFFVATKNTKVLFYSSISVAVTNIGLDYALIFGHFGLPELGIKGAAIASVIAEFSGVIFFIIYTIKNIDVRFYNFKFTYKIDASVFKSVLSISIPIMLQNLLTFGSWFVFFSIIEQLGENELAISHVIRSIYMIMMIPLLGFSTSTNALVSNLIGEKRIDLIFKLIKRMLILTLLSSGVVVIFTSLFGSDIIYFYQLEESLVKSTVSTLSIINYVLFFFSVAFILFNTVVGIGKTRISLLIEFINICIYLSTAFVLVNFFNPTIEQVWCVEFFYFTFLALMSFLYLRFGKWTTQNKY